MSTLCPACSAPAACFDTRRRKSGVVWRRYECSECPQRFTTEEAVTRLDARDHPLRGAPFQGVRGDRHQTIQANDPHTA